MKDFVKRVDSNQRYTNKQGCPSNRGRERVVEKGIVIATREQGEKLEGREIYLGLFR